MPDSLRGFTGTEIVQLMVDWTGKSSSTFRSFVERILPLTEFYYSKLHDWDYLRKRNLSLTVTSGTAEYALTEANIGYVMLAKNVDRIFSPANDQYVEKTTLDTIRRGDPASDDGAATAPITKWAPGDDNTVVFWPPTFKDTSLRIEGTIQPSALSDMANYPTVPYDKQWSFLKLVYAVCLERENDDKARSMLEEAKLLIREDIQAEEQTNATGLDDALQHRWEKRINSSIDRLLNDIDGLNMRR